MSDQEIVETITEAIHGLRVMAPVGALNGSDTRAIAGLVIAALRERYAITPYEGLRANRFTIVELPEPHSITDHTAGWPGGGDKWAVSRNVGKVLADRPKALDPDEARDFAAALLAAADAAEATPSGLDEFHPDTSHNPEVSDAS